MNAGPDASLESRGIRLGLLGVCGFSLTLPMTRIAVAQIDPVVVGLGRSMISAALATVFLLWKRDPFPGRRHIPSLLVVALGVIVGFPLFSALALRHVPASHGAVVTGIIPLFTAVFGALLAHERPSGGFWLSSLAGTVTVLIFVYTQSGLTPTPADILLLAAVVSCGLGYAEGGRLSRSLGGLRVISWSLVLAAPFLAVPVGMSVWTRGLHASPLAWTALIYMGVVSMFLAFWAWYEGLALGGVARVSQVQLLQPFLTIGAAWGLLGEHIAPGVLIAACIVVASVGVGRRFSITRAQ